MKSDLLSEILKMLDNKENWETITEYINKETGQSYNVHTVRHGSFLLKWYKENGWIKKPSNNQPVGVFSDIHAPFTHPNFLKFVKDTFDKFNVGRTVLNGDIVDNHTISRHEKEPCSKGAYDELDMAIEILGDYSKAFPDMDVTIGNHDTRIETQAATAGIGSRFLVPNKQLLKLPDTWNIQEEVIIDNVLYKHGINCGGADGAINTAILERRSTVIGHFHSNGGVKYSANKDSIIFGMNEGCGIDIDAYAFAYGKKAKYRPTLGCGIVFNSGYAIFVPMGAEYFRSK